MSEGTELTAEQRERRLQRQIRALALVSLRHA